MSTPQLVRDCARASRRAAFTLMEVLVVVAIIVILAGVGVVYLLPRLGEAKDSIAKTKIKSLTEACGLFEINNQRRPGTLEELTMQQPNGGKPLVPPDAIISPWGRNVPYVYDSSGQHNGGLQVDISIQSPDTGALIFNWPDTTK